MSRPPVARSAQVIRALERTGFFVHHHTGGHAIMRHETDLARRVTVPNHSRDLKLGTMRAILKQSGLSVEELNNLL